MNASLTCKKAKAYLHTFCDVKPNRRVGSPGNRAATEFLAGKVKSWGVFN